MVSLLYLRNPAIQQTNQPPNLLTNSTKLAQPIHPADSNQPFTKPYPAIQPTNQPRIQNTCHPASFYISFRKLVCCMLSLDFLVLKVLFCCACTLDYQTQVDMKQAGQPEQASLNQCQIIAQNSCSAHAQLMLAIRFLCNVNDIRVLIGPCSHVTSR